jgi:membrane protein
MHAGRPRTTHEDIVCAADHPSDITDRGWVSILRRLAYSLSSDGMWLRSAGVAYCALFAAIPGAAVPVAIFGLLADPQAVHRPVELLGGLLPSNATGFLADQLQSVALTSRTQLGAGLGGAVLSALWGAWSGASGLIAALNVVYREDETRSLLRRSWDALVIAVAAGTFMLVTFALIAVAPVALSQVSSSPALGAALSLARWPALAVLGSFALAMLYRFAPSRRAAKWRWVSPGAIVGTALWLVGSTGFSFFVSHAPSYNQTLGILGTIMLMLSWSYLTSFAILLGAELNAELERQTSSDTTTGPAQPPGMRGAAVADQIAIWPRQSDAHAASDGLQP